MRIGDVIARDLSRPIEEIVKVTQRDEATVSTEITEYVATDRIRGHYRRLLDAIASAPSDPHEGIGVWVSGFFGSGKSAFAKNLGYILANPEVLGTPAAQLLKRQLDDPGCAALIDNIVARIPTVVVMFDLQAERAAAARRGSIAVAMYRALLRELGYAEDLEIAELEQTLEAEGLYDEFVERFEARFRQRFEADPERYRTQLDEEHWRWTFRRRLAHRLAEASAVLHELKPEEYPQPESWARSPRAEVEVTPAFLAKRTFDLAARRRPGHTVAYIVDEVGAYVAQSVDRIEELRAIVEQLGKEGKNRVLRRQAVAPVWLVVTSQEKLDEVVEALDARRVELARLRDRFRYEIDLQQTDIQDVVSRRVLEKTPEGRKALASLYDRYEGEINERLRLERSGRRTQVSREDFVRFYPYPPHFIDLSIEVMSGIRLQPGAARHLGGSNRTIIKQAFEMLTSERTRLADEELGRLVTLDLVYQLVETNLASERTRDIAEIGQRFGDGSWEVRVARVLTLLEFIQRDLPRSEANIAAMLYDRLGAPSAIQHVREALENLTRHEFVRATPEGYKLQSAMEKNWTTRRRQYAPRPRQRHEILRDMLAEIVRSDLHLARYRYRDIRSFNVGLTVDDVRVEDGDLSLRLVSAEPEDTLGQRRREIQAQSREDGFRDEVFWLFALDPEIDELVQEVYRSDRMIREFEQLRAQGRIQAEESQLLENERHQRSRLRNTLKTRLEDALAAGVGLFRGQSWEGATLGSGAADALRALLERVVPDLYPKLELGACRLTGNEVEQLLRAANLTGLPQVFYGGDGGLELVVQREDRWVPNLDAPTAREVLGFIRERSDYGEPVDGKTLERRFTGLGYGWSLELAKLVTAVLFRGNAIEVAYQGRRYRDPNDPEARRALTDTRAFRKATFAPRKAIGIVLLTQAADALEALTGEQVEIEESSIAQTLKDHLRQHRPEVESLLATVAAHGLPWREELEELASELEGILAGTSDDCVRTLVEKAETLRQGLDRARRIAEFLKGGGLEAVRRARRVLETVWPQVEPQAGEELRRRVEAARELLASPELHEKGTDLTRVAEAVLDLYRERYAELHARRFAVFERAIEDVKALPQWAEWVSPELDPEDARARVQDVLGELMAYRCTAERPAALDGEVCPHCRTRLETFESQILAVEKLRARAMERLWRHVLREEAEPVRVRLREVWDRPITSDEDVDRLIERLRERLMRALDRGRHVILE